MAGAKDQTRSDYLVVAAPVATSAGVVQTPYQTGPGAQGQVGSQVGGSSGGGGGGGAGPTGPTGPIGPTGATGLAVAFRVELFSANQSTAFNSSTKAVVGSKYFDPNAAMWHLTGTSTITFYMLLETTNAGIAAAGDLFQQTGTGSPTIVASVPTTTGITATLVSVNVSTAFRPGANAGIFVARTWITTANGNDYATCVGAWLEFIP